jgi:hypothetical protein
MEHGTAQHKAKRMDAMDVLGDVRYEVLWVQGHHRKHQRKMGRNDLRRPQVMCDANGLYP